MAEDQRRQVAALGPAGGEAQAVLGPPRQYAGKIVLPAGAAAFLAALGSLTVCYGSIVMTSLLGVQKEQLFNPHVQAVLMWGLALVAVFALWRDRRRHGGTIPLALGIAALAILVGTLYLSYDGRVESLAYVLLTIAALLNWVTFLGALNRTVRDQAQAIDRLNRSLASRVESQGQEIGRLARLKQFLAPQVAELVVSEGKEALLATHRRYVACLFCDIRGFTALSEEIEPEELIALLEDYHAMLGGLVEDHGGTIGFLAGDGAMVFFNDPVPCEEPVLDAVKLACDLRRAFDAIREPWARRGETIGLGIGIASGFATLGLVGFKGRSDYTAIGNVVNVAARLCDTAAEGQILLSQRAHADVEGQVKAEAMGSFDLKGVRKPVGVYDLRGLVETPA
ncbi:adenylate/guanylate cyclase domain-containing protein [Pelagibius marinus]|uniref:adenylate/guanylate cyclase domain-containing protein n=1 Tax=Pelagibius marinus TaxID=2762760 RepID=UPI00187249C8|nr:adenylate/guanylate cyclase domain-containing protein [Pelagibius marinus]